MQDLFQKNIFIRKILLSCPILREVSNRFLQNTTREKFLFDLILCELALRKLCKGCKTFCIIDSKLCKHLAVHFNTGKL